MGDAVKFGSRQGHHADAREQEISARRTTRNEQTR